MTRPFLPLLVLLALAAPAPGQAFTDPDFEFTFTPPGGMRMLPEEERVHFFEITPGVGPEMAPIHARNIPRSDVQPDEAIVHNHIWVDPADMPYRRQIQITLTDGALPFKQPPDFTAQLTRSGLKVDEQQVLEQPPLGPGMIVEGRWRQADGTEMAKMAVCLFDAERYVILQLQCLGADYMIVEPQFRALLDSVDWPRRRGSGAVAGPAAGQAGAPAAGPAAAPQRARPGAPAVAPSEAKAPRGVDEGDWRSLQTLGSLILAAFVLGHLVLER